MTPKQDAFVREYLKDLNASAAYQRAGYRATGNAAEVGASRLLRNPKVAEAITAAQAERAARVELTADWVLTRLREEATLRGEGSSHGARVRATELVGKHLGMFVERHEVGGPDGGPIPITAVEAVRPAPGPDRGNA